MATKKQITVATDRLYSALANYVKVRGGSVVVAGGVQVIQYVNSPKYRWSVEILCTGVPPQKEAAEQKMHPTKNGRTKSDKVLLTPPTSG